jgi:hypothetical protein
MSAINKYRVGLKADLPSYVYNKSFILSWRLNLAINDIPNHPQALQPETAAFHHQKVVSPL